MKLQTSVLKTALKQLDPVATTEVWFDTAVGFVAAQDTNLQMISSDEALQDKDGRRICLNRKQLSSIVSRGTGELELEFEAPGAVEIRTKRAKYNLQDFTKNMSVPVFPDKHTTFPLPALREMLLYANTAAERKQSYLYTGTIQLVSGGGKIAAAGSDSHRLALMDAPAEGIGETTFHLPLPMVAAISKLEFDKLELGETENATYAAAGDAGRQVLAVARRLAGTWPDYRKFIPAEFSLISQLRAEAVKEALEDVSPMVVGDGKEAVDGSVHLVFNGGVLELSARAAGTAEASIEYEQLEPDLVFSDPVHKKVTLNHRYLTDFFSQVSGPVRLSMNEPNTPVWLEAGNKKLLVMPIRVAGQL
jgi:DNA polymerase III sliding clamp (beta) subunit (PCNA family)